MKKRDSYLMWAICLVLGGAVVAAFLYMDQKRTADTADETDVQLNERTRTGIRAG